MVARQGRHSPITLLYIPYEGRNEDDLSKLMIMYTGMAEYAAQFLANHRAQTSFLGLRIGELMRIAHVLSWSPMPYLNPCHLAAMAVPIVPPKLILRP